MDRDRINIKATLPPPPTPPVDHVGLISRKLYIKWRSLIFPLVLDRKSYTILVSFEKYNTFPNATRWAKVKTIFYFRLKFTESLSSSVFYCRTEERHSSFHSV